MEEAQYLLPTAQACQRLADVGGIYRHPQKALHYAELAVKLWQRLAEQELLEYGPKLIRSLKRLSIEQLTPQDGWGKAPLREARRIKWEYLKLRILNMLGSYKSSSRDRQARQSVPVK